MTAMLLLQLQENRKLWTTGKKNQQRSSIYCTEESYWTAKFLSLEVTGIFKHKTLKSNWFLKNKHVPPTKRPFLCMKKTTCASNMLTGVFVESSLSENRTLQCKASMFTSQFCNFISYTVLLTKNDDPTSLWYMASVISTVNIVVMGTTWTQIKSKTWEESQEMSHLAP